MNFLEKMQQESKAPDTKKSFKNKKAEPYRSNLTREQKLQRLKHIREKSGYIDLGRRYTDE